MERPPSLPTSASSSHFHPPSVSSAVEPEPYPSQSAGKRKADGDADAPDKRRRLGLPDSAAHLPPVAGLPAHLWQNVFLYLPPVSLGRLLQVNRAFYTLLTRVDEPDHGSHLPPSQRLVSSESIWSSARKTYFPTIPRPLMAHSELSMWRLLKGRRCQFCSNTPRFDPHPASVWEGGPGADGVRVIWHFGIRSCGRCLQERSQSEQSLLFAVSSTALLAALPCVFVTHNLHTVPSSILTSTPVPPNITLSKWFYREHVQDINRQFEEVRALGPAAGEEWLKGLEDMGRRRMADAERWERWERKGGFQDLHPPRRQSVSPSSIASSSQQTVPVHAAARQLPMNGVPRAGEFALSISPRLNGACSMRRIPTFLESQDKFASYTSQYPVTSAEQSTAPQSLSPGASQLARPERSIRDANEAKAARKIEIERRCQEFNPPISPNVLRHMKAFQAACQISSPLTEKAWEMLKPRLEAQRDEAEKVEHERAAQMAALQVKLEDRRQQDASLKEVREVLEREWEEVQRPVREKLGAYADDITQRDWMEGRSLTKDNCPQFAADLLIEIRSRFYADLAQEDEAALAAGQEIREDPPTGPPTRRLLLENMKWVFDNKIKPLTEQFRKELFLCNGEGCEGNPKWYGFEGIIQHYGAKHTTAFSVGNVVVCWKEADWPEEPPFHPDPSKARYGFYNGHPPSSMPGPGPAQHAYPAYPYGGFSQGGAPMSQAASRTPHPFVQSSPGPYAQYGSTNGPFPPPPVSTSANFYGPPHGAPQSYGPPSGSVPPYAGSSQAQWHDIYVDPAQGQYGPPPAGTGPYGPYRGGPHESPPALSVAGSRGPPATNVYREQMQVLTDVARDFWTSTSGVRDLPPSVRLSVVIYHILYHFNLRFGIEPSLDLFADALDSHHSMHPLNSVTGLRCKACALGFHNHAAPFNSSSSSSSSSHSLERNFSSLLSLVLHFKSEHMERAVPGAHDVSPGPQSDWKKDMINLPDDSVISALVQSPGMDDHKLRIIAEAFPTLFPSPLPHIGTVPDDEDLETGRPANPPREASPLRSRFADDQGEARHEQRQEPTPVPRARPPPLSGTDYGDSPTARSPMAPPTAPPSGDGEYYTRHRTLEPEESRMSRRPIDHSHSPRGDRRMRTVYYEEPRYYVPREFDEHGYSAHRRESYVPLSPAASRRYSYYGRVYEETWDRPRREERYSGGRDFEAHERVPTRAGLRYLDRPELSAAPSPANPNRPVSRQRNEENTETNSIKQETRSPMPPDVEAAADRFLDDLATGERVREYVSRAARDEDEMEHAENRTRQSSRAPKDAATRAEETADGQAPQSNPARDNGYEQYVPRGGGSTAEPEPHHPRYSHGSRYSREEDYRPVRRREPEPRRYTYAPSRYRRVGMYPEEPYHYSHRLVRSRSSRYGRYEAARRQLEQSKSPTREGTSAPEPRQRSERRSPGPPMYDGRFGSHYPHHSPPREYMPYEEREQYSPGPPPGYRYADAAPAAPPPSAYVNEYGEVIEYVRIRDPYHDHRYAPGPPPESHGHYVEYLPYERQRRYEPVHEDRHYVYYPERRPYFAEHGVRPYYPEQEGRGYDMDSSVPPPHQPSNPPPGDRERERQRESAFVEEPA
ncbi:hypothetical protein B0J12DRAFT_566322 [Macrophomina phaseolina]|uniref:F-box domain-containing protein n=1 Tax=Macrophomina phaseolina TaxID=35725 RepID=A0ABQ8GLI7_9PEZI|nr:hypothetical protein B0J12DRAFT_566322 [Macrophomina phaseolina]